MKRAAGSDWDDLNINHRVRNFLRGEVGDFANDPQPRGNHLSSIYVQIDCDAAPPPYGWERCLDMQTGVVYYKASSTGMSSREAPGLEPITGDNAGVQQQQPCRSSWGVLESMKEMIAFNESMKRYHPIPEESPSWTPRVSVEPPLHQWERDNVSVEPLLKQEKPESWTHNISEEQSMQCLLPEEFEDWVPSLELSLRLETPNARESTSQFSQAYHFPFFAAAHNTVKLEQQDSNDTQVVLRLDQLQQPCMEQDPHLSGCGVGDHVIVNVEHPGSEETQSTVEVEQPLRPSGQSFLSPDCIPVKLEPCTSFGMDHVSAESSMESSNPGADDYSEQSKYRVFLGPKVKSEPTPMVPLPSAVSMYTDPLSSSAQQSAACTEEKVKAALRRSQVFCA